MPVNRGPSFARYHSAIAAAAALKAEKVKKERKEAAELPQAEAWRTPTDLGLEHQRDVA